MTIIQDMQVQLESQHKKIAHLERLFKLVFGTLDAEEVVKDLQRIKQLEEELSETSR